MPPDPPRRSRLPSVTEINVAPIRNTAITVRPQADARPPPKELAGPRKPLPTQPDPDDDGDRPSVIEAVRSANTLTAELAQRNRELAEAKAALEAAKRASPKPSVPPEKFDAVAYFTRFQVIALKILLPLAAVAAAVGVTLGIYSKAAIEPKVDRAVDKQEAQDKKTVTVEDRVLVLEKYARAHSKWATCMAAQRDSAIERGTGHRTDSDHQDVEWIEQSKPSAVPRPLWKTAPWSIAKEQGCGAEPAPPSTPPTMPMLP